jgi:hypothetical protein
MSAVRFLFRPAPYTQLCRIHLAFADGEDRRTHRIKVVTMKKEGKVGRIVFTLIVACLRQVTEMARRGVVEPQTQPAGLHDQRQASLLLFIVNILIHELLISRLSACKVIKILENLQKKWEITDFCEDFDGFSRKNQ